MKKIALIFPILLATAALAQHQYYFSDTLTAPSSAWQQNGYLQFTPYGLGIDPYDPLGSLIRTIPDSMAEVRTTLSLKSSGGSYVTYLRASMGALTTGVYYSIVLSNPTFSGGGCTATLAAYRYNNGQMLLASTTVPCHDGMAIRAVMNARSEILVFIDDVNYMWFTHTEITSGQPGIGVQFTPEGSTISLVQLDPLDPYAPNAVNSSSIQTILSPNRVEAQWQAVTDPGNAGVWCYRVYRDGQFLGDYLTPGFSDATTAPNTTYTYTIYAIDFHGNFSPATSFNVTTPRLPADALNPIRIGVRPLGSYWGAAGEQIDTRSGNLNFTLGLLKALGRGGWGAAFALSYNSQLWRQYGSTTWELGRDVGYGFGWQLMAGSILPLWGRAVYSTTTSSPIRAAPNTALT